MKVIDAYVQESDLYSVMGEDSELIICDYFVEVKTENGTYVHGHMFKGHSLTDVGSVINFDAPLRAESLAKKVLSRGYIDPRYWIEVNKKSYALGEIDEYELMDEQEKAIRYG